jgi:hypothetical protein
LFGYHRSSSALSLCWRRSSGGFTSLTTCSSRGIFLFVHVVVFEVLVSVLDEKVVDCFLPCFANRQLSSRLVRGDLLLAHESGDDLVIGSTRPEGLEITHDILVDLLGRVDGSLDLINTRRRDSGTSRHRSRASGDKEGVSEDLGHLQINNSHTIHLADVR